MVMRNSLLFCFLMISATSMLLGCQKSAMEEEADRVRSTSQREADEVRERSQVAADQTRSRADDAESQADAIEAQGERTADEIEARGEQQADALEAAEDEYWRQNYATRPYVREGAPYEDYRAAYLFGWQARQRYPGQSFDEARADLEREWNAAQLDSDLTWEEAQHPARDAWDRVR
jgi:hypothetical protein